MLNEVILAIGVAALASCASSPPSPPPAAPSSQATKTDHAAHHGPNKTEPRAGMMGSGMMSRDMARICPMGVERTTVQVEDIEGGTALVFTTQGDVAELRRRVAHMADMHANHDDRAREHAAKHAKKMPASSASSEEVEGGARLLLKAKDPSDVDALRAHARQHAKKMASGKCSMMAEHAHSVAPQPTGGNHD